jgi:hypothetical protein
MKVSPRLVAFVSTHGAEHSLDQYREVSEAFGAVFLSDMDEALRCIFHLHSPGAAPAIATLIDEQDEAKVRHTTSVASVELKIVRRFS